MEIIYIFINVCDQLNKPMYVFKVCMYALKCMAYK